MNASQFSAKLNLFASRGVIGGAERAIEDGGLAGYRQFIQSIPVDKGNARNSVRIGIGRKPPRIPDITNGAFLNAQSADGGLRAFSRFRLGQTIYLTSYQSYIEILENGGFIPKNPGPSKDPRPGRKGRILVSQGHSTQAPQGMSRGAINVAVVATQKSAVESRIRGGRR